MKAAIACVKNLRESKTTSTRHRLSHVHVHEVLKRLGAFAPLNVADDKGFDPEVVREAIDLTSVFQTPQLLYFHLSATLAPGTAPALARLATYFLLASATQTERRVPVYLVIDEFQRMVAHNIEYMLQLARSMGVGIILANQSMEDLRTGTTNLIPPIEANCRYRQWFSVSSQEDRQRLIAGGGEMVEEFVSRSESNDANGSSRSKSVSVQVMPRLSVNDVSMASDHPKQSIVRIARGEGYAQYGGLPVICKSDLHIDTEEYERRRQMTWPMDAPGTFIPADHGKDENQSAESRTPLVTSEVIDGMDSNRDPLGDLIDDWKNHSL